MSLPFDSRFYKSILEKMNTNLYITDAETDEIVYMNRQMKQVFKFDHVEGQVCWKVLQKGMTERCEFCRIRQLMENPGNKSCLWREKNPVSGRIYLNHDSLEEWNGRLYHIQNSIDITDQVELSRVAAYDELTGIFNRKAGWKRLDEWINGMKSGERFTMVLYDINGLKWVNDTYGHLEGDRLLLFVAKNIQQSLSEPDFIFRLSGDEFIIAFKGRDEAEVEEWMHLMLDTLREKRRLIGMDYEVSFSYGVACSTAGEKLSVSDLLSIADARMYIKKRDHHILMGQKRLQRERTAPDLKPPFQFNKDYLFDALAESMDDYSFAGNLKTGEFMYSSGMVADFDLPGQVLSNAAAFWGDKIHPEDVEGFLRSNQEIADGRAERHAISYRARNASGDWVHLLCKGRMIRDEKGEPDLFAGVIKNLDGKKTQSHFPVSMDMTELEELLLPVLNDSEMIVDGEQTQEEGNGRQAGELQFLVESSTGGLFEAKMSEGFPLRYANESYYRLHGYTREQFFRELDNRAGLVVHEKDAADIASRIKKLIRDGETRVTLEYRIIKRDTSIAWMHVDAGLATLENGTVVMIGMVIDITQRHLLEEQLLHTQQLFQIARKHTRMSMWEYDIRHHRIIHTEEEPDEYGLGKIVDNVPESLIGQGIVHPESVEAVRNLYRQINEGKNGASAQVRLKSRKKKGEYWWAEITYTLLPGADGKADWAVGVSEDISGQKAAEIRIFEEESMRKLLAENLLFGFRLNLERDCLESIFYNRGRVSKKGKDTEGYAYIAALIADSIAYEEDRKRYEEAYAPDSLSLDSENAESLPDFEFRQKQEDGRILWVRLAMSVAVAPENGERILFGYISNVDQQKKRELALTQKALTDEVSGFYHFTTAKLMVEELLHERRQERGLNALLLLDIDHFREVNRLGGILAGDGILRQMAEVIREGILSSCIAGRLSGDMFLVFCYCMETEREVLDFAERLRRGLCGQYQVGEQELEISVSAGIAFDYTNEMNYDQLSQFAHFALDAAKCSGRNRLQVYREDNIHSAGQAHCGELFEFLEVCWEKVDRGCSRQEVLMTLFRRMSELCHVGRISLYERTDGQEAWAESCCWQNAAFQDELKVDEKMVEEALAGHGDGEIIWVEEQEAVLGLYDRKELVGFLVLEGLAKEPETRACSAVLHFLKRSGRLYRLDKRCDYLTEYDSQTGLKNYASYSRVLENVSVETCSSFGIVCLQIVDLKKYDLKYGKIHGDRLVQFAAGLMKEIFDIPNCFHTGRSSFLALCPDVAYESFQEKCERLAERAEKSYPGGFVSVKVWEQNPVSSEQMQAQLEDKLRIAVRKRREMEETEDEFTVSEIKRGVIRSVADGSFCIFLQPKADVETGKICGAEALVRYMHPEKGLIAPARFLPAIEKAGVIRFIDLFVLQEVCRVIQTWQKQGWSPFPISLNFSRTTILEPGILAEVDRIVDRAGIVRELIEIEVTETISSIDNMGLKDIVDQFIGSGYQIALDDFGTEYSNIYVLSSLNLHSLKLDRRIVKDIYHDDRARMVAESIISLCRKLHITSVAEGVETPEILEVLKEIGCDTIQGYYLNKPLPEEEFRRYYIKN